MKCNSKNLKYLTNIGRMKQNFGNRKSFNINSYHLNIRETFLRCTVVEFNSDELI